MAVTCPACGGVSRDEEFCDQCNADLALPSALPPPAACPVGPEGTLPLSARQVRYLCRPEAAVTLWAGSRAWRLHWVPAPFWSRWQPRVEERLTHDIRCLPPCRVIPGESGFWVVAEAIGERYEPWVEEERLDTRRRLRRLADFVDLFRKAVEPLHAAGLVWLTFDPAEMELAESGLRFTNLDLVVFPGGQCPPQLTIAPAFVAPEVCTFQAGEISARPDVFHLALFAFYWLARYLPQGFLGDGLEAFQFAIPPLRIFAPDLPPGISGVLSRGLALDPEQRFASIGEFAAAFRTALDRAEWRWQSTLPVRWGVNEDCVRVRQFSSPERALVVVADGISSCDVGSGEVASRTACDVVEAAFGPDNRAVDFPQRITTACRLGAEALLEWALQRDQRQRLLIGHHLMGTTLTVAWLEGNSLLLANLGDSRAYLIHEGCKTELIPFYGAEQLTVDGDLGCALLAANAPPEEVKELGSLAKALRDCVGGCYRTPRGELAIDEDRCRPALSRWPLLPGDVIVLCTDGLVEEGAFLEPEELAALVWQHRALPPQALAEKLADMADARQRLPSADEPEGFGDNITCAVIKIANPC
jgi:serine/threonine protein phosphatase PrpC